MTEPVRVLWTGGWDSTYRVLDLAISQRSAVEPVYVSDPDRASTPLELAAMHEIRVALAATDTAAADRIGELALLERLDGEDEYQRAWERIRHDVSLGSQYHWLPRTLTAAGFDGADMSVLGGAKFAGLMRGHLERFPEGQRVTETAPADIRTLFSMFRFPLFGMGKAQLGSLASEKGFSELMELTWFCFSPRRGQPCGVCNPCTDARSRGLERRVPAARLRRASRSARGTARQLISTAAALKPPRRRAGARRTR